MPEPSESRTLNAQTRTRDATTIPRQLAGECGMFTNTTFLCFLLSFLLRRAIRDEIATTIS